MLSSADLVAFAATTDLPRARAFYEGVLDLTVIEETPIALVFRSGATTLRVTEVETPARAPYTVLGWDVVDIDATVDGLAGRGVEFNRYDGMDQDERGIWTAPSGARVAWFLDPDGNNLSLTEMPD